MKQSEIEVGGKYIAKVSGKLVTVRVDRIGETEQRMPTKYGYTGNVRYRHITYYAITNMATGRELTFRSAQKFRRPATEDQR